MSTPAISPAAQAIASQLLAGAVPPTSAAPAVQPNTSTSTPVQPPPLPKKKLLKVKFASEYDIEKTHWIWEERVPLGALTLTPGRGGIGKSTFHAWIVAAITKGTLQGDYLGIPRYCVIAATEDSWSKTIVPRLSAAGADLSRVINVEVDTQDAADGGFLVLPSHLDDLQDIIRDYEVALVSIDPLLGVIDAKLDSYKDAEVRKALAPLTSMAERTNCVILGNAHYTKAGSDPLTSIMGSAAFGNVARAGLGFAQDKDAGENMVVMSQIKNNLGKMNVPSLLFEIVDTEVMTTHEGPTQIGKLEWRGESNRSVFDVMGDSRSHEERSVAKEVEQWLREMLRKAGGEISSKKLEAAARVEGYSPITIKRARKNLRVKSDQRSDGWYLVLPDDDDLVPAP